MTQVLAPCPGTAVPMTEVPDPVFSGGIVGSGVGIDPRPEPTTVRAPVAGTVVKVHPHAFVIAGEDGVGVLVHLGINTVALDGAGFTVHAAKGDQVAAGDPMVDWNPAELPEQADGKDISAVVPVVVLDTPAEQVTSLVEGELSCGDALLRVDPA